MDLGFKLDKYMFRNEPKRAAGSSTSVWRGVLMRRVLVARSLVLATPRAAQQVEIDRTLQRVNGTAIMTSDVRQARF